jgi:CubicO group peptidase (beta-lactamase class C family)
MRSSAELSRSLVAVIAALAMAGCAVSVERQEPGRSASLESTLDRWADEFIDSGSVAGFSVAVEKDGRMLVAKGYGMADLEQKVEATDQTVYRIGSITKQFTAAAIMRLVEAGEVDLQAPIQDYVDFPTGDHLVTVEHLLHHTSGIKSYTGLGESWRRTVPLDLTHDELLGLVVDEPFDFAPGDEYRYNNSGYYLLGVIIENLTEMTYTDHIEQTLAAPLGLERTTYCDEKRLIAGRAEGYEYEDGALVNDDPISMTQPFAAGSMCSTVTDLLAWQAALESGEVVSAASYAQMTTAGVLNNGEGTSYGYGLGLRDLEGHRRVAHGGGINGFATMLASYPDDKLRVTVLTNTPGPTAGPLSDRIAREVLELGPAPETDEE